MTLPRCCSSVQRGVVADFIPPNLPASSFSASQANFGQLYIRGWDSLCIWLSFFGENKEFFGTALNHLGAILGHLGTISGDLGTMKCHLGVILGLSGAVFDHLDAILGHLGTISGDLGTIKNTFGSFWDSFTPS